jgi:hypothetical protein
MTECSPVTTHLTQHETAPARISQPRLLLHLEGLALLVGAVALYSQHSADWLAFILLLFVPDISMIGYLANPRLGAAIYNLAHTYSLPLALGLVALAGGWSLGVSLALIWFAHISLDRALGYGLKYDSFKDTHLNRL